MWINIEQVCAIIEVSGLYIHIDGKYDKKIWVFDKLGEHWYSFDSEVLQVKFKGDTETNAATYIVEQWQKGHDRKIKKTTKQKNKDKLEGFYENNYF